jgi:hypothetical protein
MKTLKKTIQSIQKKTRITNNTQRAGIRLLSVAGEWVPRSYLRRIPSATSRVRDLRKDEFGAFRVECKSSDDLERKTNHRTFYYRINPYYVTHKQIDTLFHAE